MPDTRTMTDRIAEALWCARMSHPASEPVRIWLTAEDVARLCVDAGVSRVVRWRYCGVPVSECGAGCISRVVVASGASVAV